MRDDVGDDRLESVREVVAGWRAELADSHAFRALLDFRAERSRGLDLTTADADALDALFGGHRVGLRTLFPEHATHRQAGAGARCLHDDARTVTEERGRDVAHVAQGFVCATAPVGVRGTPRRLRAPLLLRPLSVRPPDVVGGDFLLSSGSRVEVNPVLLYALAELYGIPIDTESVESTVERASEGGEESAAAPRAAYAHIADAALRGGMRTELDPSVVADLFDPAVCATAADTAPEAGLLPADDHVAAIAGDTVARNRLAERAAAHGPAPGEHGSADGGLVCAADSAQRKAVDAAVAGRDVVLRAPPGTGRGQTLANIIARAAARGERVLFVSHKRAAIESVTARLADLGLGRLVFDPHRECSSTTPLGARLAANLDRLIGQGPPQASESGSAQAARGEPAGDYPAELHKPRPPWGVSAYQAQAELLDLGGYYRTPHSIRGRALHALDARTVREVEDGLERFVNLGGLRVVRGDTPWANASVPAGDDVRAVLAELNTLTQGLLRRSEVGMRGLLNQSGLAWPAGLDGWSDVLELLDAVSASVRTLGPDIFDGSLDRVWHATASWRKRRHDSERVGWLERRRLLNRLRSAVADGSTAKRELRARVDAVVEQRARWRALGGARTRPGDVVGLDDVLTDYTELRASLGTVAATARMPDLPGEPIERVAEVVAALSADRSILLRLAEITALRHRFESLGLGPLLTDLAERDVAASQAPRFFRHAWLDSLLDEMHARVAALREFDPRRRDAAVAEFRRADAEHIDTSARHVHGLVARNLRRVQQRHRDQADVLRGQARRRRADLDGRTLVETCPDVLFALHPCWAMSPLTVGETLPARRLFDIVIIDEANQLDTRDAVTSVARAARVVVAGDEQQPPPATSVDELFARTEDPADESGARTVAGNSIMDSLSPVVPERHTLRWHYRGADERLLAFANHEFYRDTLVTFPGCSLESPITSDTVDTAMDPSGVDRVVREVRQHARLRPEESLGVITLDPALAERVDRAVRDVAADSADVAELLTARTGRAERFFVKSVDTVAGDVRDAIILSTVTATSDSDDSVTRPLGLSTDARWVNAAVTRAKRRMTVLSTADRSELEGREALRRCVEFAARGGDTGDVERRLSVRLDGLQRDVARVLGERGITVEPLWGASDRPVELALAHAGRPDTMVLALETDGERYHRTGDTRERDRLRARQLETLGWHHHRVWSRAWFTNRAAEADRIELAWQRAMAAADRVADAGMAHHPVIPRPRPELAPGLPITEYTQEELVALSRWLVSGTARSDPGDLVRRARDELAPRGADTEVANRLTESLRVALRMSDLPRH